MAKVSTPVAHPPQGTYDTELRVTLTCATSGARIHYTSDGSTPTRARPLYDPYKLIHLQPASHGDKGLPRQYVVQAIALKDGMAPSAVAKFSYTIARRDADQYISQEIHPGVRMIADYESCKMFLIVGSRRALLIDAGFGGGDLRGYVESFTRGLPLDVAVTHAHPDHIARLGQFVKDCNVYMNLDGMTLLKSFVQECHFDIDPANIKDMREGFSFDLGGRMLHAYELPGHMTGSVVLLDEQNGYLFSGDALGSNRPHIPDSLFLQFEYSTPIAEFLATLKAFRSKLRGRFKEIWTGHNDVALHGETYLDNLQQAAQNLVDWGPGALVPAIRPAGDWQIIVGDRLTDPDWVAISVKK